MSFKRVAAFTPIPKHLRTSVTPPVSCAECGQTRHDADSADYACCMTQAIADVLAGYGVEPWHRDTLPADVQIGPDDDPGEAAGYFKWH